MNRATFPSNKHTKLYCLHPGAHGDANLFCLDGGWDQDWQTSPSRSELNLMEEIRTIRRGDHIVSNEMGYASERRDGGVQYEFDDRDPNMYPDSFGQSPGTLDRYSDVRSVDRGRHDEVISSGHGDWRRDSKEQYVDGNVSYERYSDHQYLNHKGPDLQYLNQPHPDRSFPDQQHSERSYPDHRHSDLRYPDRRYPDPRYPDQQRPDPRYPDQQRPDPRYPDQQRPDPRYSDQQRPDPQYLDQQRPDARYPDEQRPDRRYPDQRDHGYPAPLCSDPGYLDQQSSDSRYPDQQPPDRRYPYQRDLDHRYPDQQRSDPHYSEKQHPDPRYPDQQRSDPHYPYQQRPDPCYPDQQRLDPHCSSDPRYSDQQCSDPRYHDQERSDPRYPDQQRSDPCYPNQQSSDPCYPDQQSSDPRYSDQQPLDPRVPDLQPPDSRGPVRQPPDPRYPNQQLPDPRYPDRQPPDRHYPDQRDPDPRYPDQQPIDRTYPDHPHPDRRYPPDLRTPDRGQYGDNVQDSDRYSDWRHENPTHYGNKMGDLSRHSNDKQGPYQDDARSSVWQRDGQNQYENEHSEREQTGKFHHWRVDKDNYSRTESVSDVADIKRKKLYDYLQNFQIKSEDDASFVLKVTKAFKDAIITYYKRKETDPATRLSLDQGIARCFKSPDDYSRYRTEVSAADLRDSESRRGGCDWKQDTPANVRPPLDHPSYVSSSTSARDYASPSGRAYEYNFGFKIEK